MSAGRTVWVKIRASEAERAEWHARPRPAGLTLSDLVRRSIGRLRVWTVAHAEVERERTHELAHLGNNLNQIARWCVAAPKGSGAGAYCGPSSRISDACGDSLSPDLPSWAKATRVHSIARWILSGSYCAGNRA